MNEAENKNRILVTAVAIGLALLLAIGGYMFWRSDDGTAAQSGNDPVKVASTAAEKALSLAGMTAEDRNATEAVIRAYILANPEVITEAVEILQKRQVADRLKAGGPAMAKAFYSAEAGNPDGDVTIVEFTDYNCGYCRSSVADVEKLLAGDRGIRLVYRELPILSPTSRDAALWALAAAKQGKHAAFHKAMFIGDRPNAASIKVAAVKAGLDLSAAQKFAASGEAKIEVDANLAMMQQIGFGGTPTFVIGDQILEGALGYDGLKAAVAKARK